MYPESFDAAQIWKRRDGKGRVKAVCTRAQCWPRYYIIDFEHSKRFSSNYQGIAFNDMTDASRTPGQNPFPNDIHYLGQFLKHHFLDVRISSVSIQAEADNPFLNRIEFSNDATWNSSALW